MSCLVDFATGGTDEIGLFIRYDVNWEKLAQGFQVTLGTEVCKLRAKLQKYGSPTGTIWLEIWTNNGGEPGSVIANGVSDTKDVSTISSTATWYDLTFSTNPTLTKSTDYWLVLNGSWSVGTTNYVRCITSSVIASPGPFSYRTAPYSEWYDRGLSGEGGYGNLMIEVWTDHTTTNIKKVSGVEHASIKKIGGVAIGSVKKIGGVE